MPDKRRQLLEDVDFRPLTSDEFRDNGDGTHSTEILIGINIDGMETVVPSLLMTPSGPKQFSAKKAREHAISYMRRTGLQFPQFKSVAEAESFSQARTQMGGTAAGALAQ